MTEYSFQPFDDQTKAERTLTHTLHCATCGYNLIHAPYVGLCPECGAAYNARPLKMENIFVPSQLSFPYVETIIAAVTISIGIPVMKDGIRNSNDWLVLLAVVFLLVALGNLRLAWRRAKLYTLYRRVIRRTAEESTDD